MTSEERYDINPQPGDTCSLIDEVIQKIDEALGYTKNADRSESIDELRDACTDVDWALDGLEDKLEAIRERVSSVRWWGQEWKDEAKRLHDKQEGE